MILVNINDLLVISEVNVKKSTLLHLRFPFSFFLMPVFLLACAISDDLVIQNTILCFFILHFLVYPASNGYNSYFDKDEDSIGGLKNPPKVSVELYWISLMLDGIALILGLFISMEFSLMIFIYGLVSKAYSHPSVRLKKYPIAGWLSAGFFQGYFTLVLSIMAVSNLKIAETLNSTIQIPAVLSTVLLLGSYPMTQVYQHEEDGRRGDQTISRKLGILGTFHFTALAFTIAISGFVYYFYAYFGVTKAILFPVFLIPVLIHFASWYLNVRKDDARADFDSTMRLNLISSLMLNLYFAYLWLG